MGRWAYWAQAACAACCRLLCCVLALLLAFSKLPPACQYTVLPDAVVPLLVLVPILPASPVVPLLVLVPVLPASLCSVEPLREPAMATVA